MNPEKWAEDIAGSPYGLKSLSSPENKPSQKQQLLKSIFMHVTNASMPDTDEKRKNWDGKIFEDFTDSMPSIYHEKFKEQLEIQGIRYRETYKRTNSQGISKEKAEIIFCFSARARCMPLEQFLTEYIVYCRNIGVYETLQGFKGHEEITEKILEEYDARDKKISNGLSEFDSLSHQSIQPYLTTPEAKEGNKNYYANVVLKVIGRKKQQDRLKAFLNCDLNVAWFQLAGEAGQGKSRLAFDLMKYASEIQNPDWRAGFLWENNIELFKDQWRDWQPDKPHLLIFDYVIGREHVIKPIIQTLISKKDQFQHKIRILLVERQRWDRGNQINVRSQGNEDALGLSGYKASWYLNLCEDSEHRDNDLSCRFEDGIEELMELDKDDLVTIVKQLFSGDELSISDDALKETLERIDNSGRPLYAYLLAQQLSETQKGYQSWTKIDLLNKQLERDKRRWEKAFWKDGKKAAPTWGDNHPAIKLAVLATMVRGVEFQDKRLKEYFGSIDSSIRREAVAITSGNLVNDDIRPRTIGALEPDLLGTWFVLYCFYNELEFEELLDIAWQCSPKNTTVFLLRITQDFIDLPKKYKRLGVIEKLLAHPPPYKSHYQDLASVAVALTYNLYRKRLAIPKNIIVSLENAVNLSNPSAMISLGFLYYQGIGIAKKPEISVALYRQAADLGNSDAMFHLGFFYQKGEGVEQDMGEAVRLYWQAVDLGNSAAMVNLGLCYEKGKGVEQDMSEAVRLYRQAVDLGNSAAIANLGLCYAQGKGVEQDINKAVRLYQQAVDLGESAAMVNLGFCYAKGEGVEQDISEAIRLYRQAANLGNSDAMFNLGFCFQKGKGVEQDINKAVRLYQQAVDLGNSLAMVNLGFCYAKGEGVEQDINKAVRLYRQAVDLGESGALVNLGSCYEKGEGVEQDINEAVRLYRQAVDLGNSLAMVNLGFCYEKGEGIEQDWDEAIDLYQRAIKAGDKNAIDYLQTILLLQNFLSTGHRNSWKTNTWLKTKNSCLAEAPVFDPPVMAGDWKLLSIKEVTDCLDKIIVPFQILGLVNNFNGYFGQYGRHLPLNFYKDCSLVEIQFHNPTNKNTLIFSAIINAENAILLNGKSNIIHKLNPYLSDFDDKQSTIDYLHFFCSYVRGDAGPFQIISNLNEIPFEKGASQNIQDEIKKSFFRPQYIEGDFGSEGWQKFEASVLYDDALFVVTFKVFPNGLVFMEGDNRIAEGLPILQRQYDGVFRTPLRPLND